MRVMANDETSRGSRDPTTWAARNWACRVDRVYTSVSGSLGF